MEEAGVPAVICCVYSGQSRPDRLMILQVLVLCGACTVQMCLCGAAEWRMREEKGKGRRVCRSCRAIVRKHRKSTSGRAKRQ